MCFKSRAIPKFILDKFEQLLKLNFKNLKRIMTQIKDFFAMAAAHFYRFDVNENGIMNVSRLQSYCQDNDLPLSDSHINNVMQNLDLKGNGRIDFHEFMTYILFMKYDIGKYTSC